MDNISKDKDPSKGQKHWSEPGGIDSRRDSDSVRSGTAYGTGDPRKSDTFYSSDATQGQDTSVRSDSAYRSKSSPDGESQHYSDNRSQSFGDNRSQAYSDSRSQSFGDSRADSYSDSRSQPYSDLGDSTLEDRSSWRDMTRDLLNDVSTMFRTEGALIRTEVNEKADMVKAGLTSIGTGSGFLLVGLFSLSATAIILLNLVMPLWLSAVIVTAVFLIVGAVLASTGKKKLEAEKLAPRRSIETMGTMSRRFKDRVYRDYKENSYENRLH